MIDNSNIERPNPKQYLFPIHAISLNLSPQDKQIYDSKFIEVEHEINKLMKIFRVLLFLLFIIIVGLISLNTFYDYLLPYMLGVFIPMSFLLFIMVYVISNIFKGRPYNSKYSQTWKRFFEEKEINGYTAEKFYQFIKSYVNQNNSSSEHFIYKLYERDYLIQLSEPKNRKQKKDNSIVVNLLSQDMDLIEKLPKVKKTKMRTYQRVNPYIVLISIIFVVYRLLKPRIDEGLTTRDQIIVISIGLNILFIFTKMLSLADRASKVPQQEQLQDILENHKVSVPPGEFYLSVASFIEEKFPYLDI